MQLENIHFHLLSIGIFPTIYSPSQRYLHNQLKCKIHKGPYMDVYVKLQADRKFSQRNGYYSSIPSNELVGREDENGKFARLVDVCDTFFAKKTAHMGRPDSSSERDFRMV